MEKINLAVLGLGGMGGTHVGAAKASPYVDKIYGYEPDPVRREARAKELDIIPATLEEILAECQDLDTVQLVTGYNQIEVIPTK